MVENKKNRSRILFEGIKYHVLKMYFKSNLLVHMLTLNLDQKYAFEQFENGPQLLFQMQKTIPFRNLWCWIAVLVYFQTCPNGYFWSRFKLRLWTKRKFAMQIQHPLKSLNSRIESTETLFRTENWTLSYQEKPSSLITSSLPVHFWLFWTFLRVVSAADFGSRIYGS